MFDRRLRWCGLAGLAYAVAALSCGGQSFTGSESGAGSGGETSQAGASSGGVSAASGDPSGGAPAASGAPPNDAAGAPSAGEAGANAGAPSTSDAGAGNTPDDSDCQMIRGRAFGGHCYVDATVTSVNQQQAVDDCARLASDLKLPGHLLVLETAEEQSFILKQLMVPYTDKSDAWLGLTCSALDWPDINDCSCATSCSKAELAEKQKAWHWLDGVEATFGWVNGNPNGAFRCAALGYNPDTMIWGWVDRSCTASSVIGIPDHPHTYRTICELEP